MCKLRRAQAANRLAAVHTDRHNPDACSVGYVDAVTDTHVRLRSVNEYGRRLGYEVRSLANVFDVTFGDAYVERIESLAARGGDVFADIEDRCGDQGDLYWDALATAQRDDQVVSLVRRGRDDLTGRVLLVSDGAVALSLIDRFGNDDGVVRTRLTNIDGVDVESEEEQIRKLLAAEPSSGRAPQSPGTGPSAVKHGVSGQRPEPAKGRGRQVSDISGVLREAQTADRLAAVHSNKEMPDACSVGWVAAVSATHVRLRSVNEHGAQVGFVVRALADVFEVGVSHPYLDRVMALVRHKADEFACIGDRYGDSGDLVEDALAGACRHERVVTVFPYAGDGLTGRVSMVANTSVVLSLIARFGDDDGTRRVRLQDIEGVDVETDEEQIRRFLAARRRRQAE